MAFLQGLYVTASIVQVSLNAYSGVTQTFVHRGLYLFPQVHSDVVNVAWWMTLVFLMLTERPGLR